MKRRRDLAEDSATAWREHRKMLRQTRRRPSARNVHALRLGTRRLLARLQAVGALKSPRGLKRTRRRLRRLLHQTGPARDAWVQLRLFENILPADTDRGRHKFHRSLRRRHRRLARKLGPKLKRYESARHGFAASRLAQKSTPAAGELQAALCRSVGRVVKRQQAARRGAPRNCHRLRMALKKIRYLTELLPAPPAGALGRLHRVQTALGDLHDFDLLLERLDKFAKRHASTARWVGSCRSRLQRHRQSLLRRQQAIRCTAAQLHAIIA